MSDQLQKLSLAPVQFDAASEQDCSWNLMGLIEAEQGCIEIWQGITYCLQQSLLILKVSMCWLPVVTVDNNPVLWTEAQMLNDYSYIMRTIHRSRSPPACMDCNRLPATYWPDSRPKRADTV